jgi:probable HAF family extracellular repeat protein
MSRLTLTTTLSILIACLLGTSAEGAAQYTVTVLNPGGGVGAAPYAINDAGQIAGIMFANLTINRAFLYENGGPMRDLGSLSGTGYSMALAINSHGQIAGDSQITTYSQHAVIFTRDGSIQDLGTLGGPLSDARGVNDLGQVVGWADTAAGYGHAFVYTQQQGMQDLGTLGGTASSGHAVSNAGTVVGFADVATMSAYHAFRYTAADGMRWADRRVLGILLHA